MIPAFQRLKQSVLAVLGEDALFNGTTPTRINVEFDVQFDGYSDSAAANRGDLALARDVATIDVDLAPKIGDRFQFVDKATGLPAGPVHKLDKYVDSNGVTKRFIVLRVA